MTNSLLARSVQALLPLAVCTLLSAQPPFAPAGKFYIVGMGTAADLITVRAQAVIAKADILIAEEGSFDQMWAGYAKGKETWQWPRNVRRFYGADPKTFADPDQRKQAEAADQLRRQLVAKITAAVAAGKTVASLQSGDPMMYGMTLFLEMLPASVPTEIIPGIGAFQAASAALKMGPAYGYDTSAVILTMRDWPGRVDVNEKLMAAGSTLVFYTMSLDYPALFEQLKRFYPAETPVAVVSDAGDLSKQKAVRSTVGRFLAEVDYKNLPPDSHMLFVGKFLTAGQARKDFLTRTPAPAGRPNP